ncbi:hypothetical protein CW304_07560 [Bacillus sp. UFRGS-B20]|nr:hypothetical protein CW304_07560 [Bacillus sp. UFRGS-B20]
MKPTPLLFLSILILHMLRSKISPILIYLKTIKKIRNNFVCEKLHFFSFPLHTILDSFIFFFDSYKCQLFRSLH